LVRYYHRTRNWLWISGSIDLLKISFSGLEVLSASLGFAPLTPPVGIAHDNFTDDSRINIIDNLGRAYRISNTSTLTITSLGTFPSLVGTSNLSDPLYNY
jgi:hypothetical protein